MLHFAVTFFCFFFFWSKALMPPALFEGLLAVRCGGSNPRRLPPTVEAWPLGHWPVRLCMCIYIERVMTNQLHTTSSIYLCSYSCVLCACAIYEIQNSKEMNVTSQ
jgi:hypothetical protein